MDKFLLAENPMTQDETFAVIHTHDPIAVIECIPGHTWCMTPYRQYSFRNLDGDQEDWTLRIHHIHFNDENSAQQRTGDLLDAAWTWYARYMNWEDNNLKTDIG